MKDVPRNREMAIIEGRIELEPIMTMVVYLREDIRARLLQKASAAGVDMPTYAARILEVEAMQTPLEEAFRPVRDTYMASGMTDDEPGEFLESEKPAARVAKWGEPIRE